MKLATTIGEVEKLCSAPAEQVKCYFHTGFKHLDYSFYNCADSKSYLLTDDWKKFLIDAKNAAESAGIDFVQAHSPGGNAFNCDLNFTTATVRSIIGCSLLGIKNIVVHAGEAHWLTREEFYAKNRDFYRTLLPYAEEYGVNILTENSAPANMGDMYYFFTGEDMKEFISYVGSPFLHGVWDTGHGNLTPVSQYDNITALESELYALHIQDNYGSSDDHVMPLCGTTDFDSVMQGLLKIGYNGYFTFEADNAILCDGTWPNYRKLEVADRRLNPDIILKKEMLSVLYKVGKYILTKYNCFEE